jgi:hypothetical protein
LYFELRIAALFEMVLTQNQREFVGLADLYLEPALNNYNYNYSPLGTLQLF